MTKETLTNDKQENLSPNEYVYGNMLHGVDYSKHFVLNIVMIIILLL